MGHSHERYADAKGLESKVVFETGNDPVPRFCLYAKELDIFGSTDIVAEVKKLVSPSRRITKLEGLSIPAAVSEWSPSPDDLRRQLDPFDELNQIAALEVYTVHPDGSLQQFSFYILWKMRAEHAKYREKARAIFKTLALGTLKKTRARP